MPVPNHDSRYKGRGADWDEETETPKSSICCLQGCLAASAVGFSFFVALPTGIILVVLSANDDDDTVLLAVGCVLIVLPVLMLVVVIVLCLNQKKLCCNKYGNKNATRQGSSNAAMVAATRASGESPA